MKKWFKPILIFLGGMGVMGIIVTLSGIVPIHASSGHWPITEWFLNFSMERSISTYATNIEPPDLSDPARIMRGAGHYEIGCRHCHGTVERIHFLGTKTTPEAPHLPEVIKNWKPQELFRIVKHGVKFTGMPAWPSLERNDEVWDIVAFLLVFSKMNHHSYEKMVYGPVTSTPVLNKCIGCHGIDGNGRGVGAFPKLAGQAQGYLENSLMAYARGERHSGTMELVAYHLPDDMIREVARYYSQQKRSAERKPGEGEIEKIKRGERIAKEGIFEQKVAACMGCHGPLASGRELRPHLPDLRGQPASYLARQLKLFIENKRGGSKHIKLMEKAVLKLTPQQIEDVSLFYSSLDPGN